jgi:hypothetical protein
MTIVLLFNNYPLQPHSARCQHEKSFPVPIGVPFVAVQIMSQLGMTIWIRVSDPMGMGTEMIFYPWVTLVPDPNRDGYETDIFSHPWVIRRVPDTLVPL